MRAKRRNYYGPKNMANASLRLLSYGLIISLCPTTPAMAAPTNVGVYNTWGAFVSQRPSRCYAIAKPTPTPQQPSEHAAYASVSSWPEARIRGQIHIRPSRRIAPNSSIRLSLGNRNFVLQGQGINAWAQNAQMDAQIVALMRSSPSMTLTATDTHQKRFTNHWPLNGAANAIDASAIACPQNNR